MSWLYAANVMIVFNMKIYMHEILFITHKFCYYS